MLFRSGNGCAWDTENPVTKNASKFAPLPTAVPTDGAAGGPGGVTGERSGGPDAAGGATATTSTGAVPDGA